MVRVRRDETGPRGGDAEARRSCSCSRPRRRARSPAPPEELSRVPETAKLDPVPVGIAEVDRERVPEGELDRTFDLEPMSLERGFQLGNPRTLGSEREVTGPADVRRAKGQRSFGDPDPLRRSGCAGPKPGELLVAHVVHQETDHVAVERDRCLDVLDDEYDFRDSAERNIS